MPTFYNNFVVRTGFEPVYFSFWIPRRYAEKSRIVRLPIPPPDYVACLSKLSSVTSARLPKTRQDPDAGLIRPSGASVPRPITKPVKVLSARKERSQDRDRTCILWRFNWLLHAPYRGAASTNWATWLFLKPSITQMGICYLVTIRACSSVSYSVLAQQLYVGL